MKLPPNNDVVTHLVVMELLTLDRWSYPPISDKVTHPGLMELPPSSDGVTHTKLMELPTR